VRGREQWRDTYTRGFIALSLGIIHAWCEVVGEKRNEHTEPTTGPHLRWDTPAEVEETPLIDQVDDSIKNAVRGILVTWKESHHGNAELGEPETTRRIWEAARKPNIVCDK